MNVFYTYRFLKSIRKGFKLTQQELANRVGISLYEYRNFELGRVAGSAFFCERMRELFGIDLVHAQSKSRVVVCYPAKIPLEIYTYLNTL